jgi:NHL repeat
MDRVGADPEAVTLHMQATRPRRLAAHARRRVTGRAALITVAFGLSLLAPAPALGAFGFVSTWGTNVDVGGGLGFEVCTATCQAGTAGSGPGGLDLPWGLAVSAAGDVYVPDLNNNRISQYTAAGTFIRAWGKDVDPGGGTGFEVCTTSCKAGTAGGGPGELNQAIGAAVDSAGNVYVTDYMNNRIDEFTATGSFVRAWGKDVDPGGGTGFEICTIACKQGAAGGAAGELNQPIGVAVGPAGDIYVGDTTNQRIQEFTSAGVSCAPGARM